MPVEVVGMTPVGIKHPNIDEISAGREVEAVDVQSDATSTIKLRDGNACGLRVGVETDRSIGPGDGYGKYRGFERRFAFVTNFNPKRLTAAEL